MPTLSYPELAQACSPGGASVLTSVAELEPAVGPHASVAPARFVDGDKSVFAFETRFIDGEAQHSVVIDSKQSQLNRIELPLLWAIREGHYVLSRVPRVEVHYRANTHELVVTDLELPHRAFDGHIRAGSVNDKPTTAHPRYRMVRDCTPTNARAMAEFSPGSLVFGSWDSTRRTRQSRYRSALVGEIIGVLSDQSTRPNASRRGGARVDPVGMSVRLRDTELLEIMNAQRDELSLKLADKIERGAARRGENVGSASELGLGGIPPSLTALGGVSCKRIIRSHVLSFATLRQLRFGSTPEGDVAVRALLSAYALAGLARSDSELCLRANCDLVEKGKTEVVLDGRFGERHPVDPLTVDDADTLLAEALDAATRLAEIRWDGQIFAVEGNPAIFAASVGDEADG